VQCSALAVLAATVPTTPQGAAELLRYAAEVEREGQRVLEDDDGKARPVSYFIQHNVAEALSRV
jgi:hypothetical protein